MYLHSIYLGLIQRFLKGSSIYFMGTLWYIEILRKGGGSSGKG